MRKLIYFATVSLDGYIQSADGNSDWVMPDEELHRHFNAWESEFDTHVMGRNTYELMASVWPTAAENPDYPPWVREYGPLWLAARKLVFSKTLAKVDWNSELLRTDPAEEVARLKQESGKDIGMTGATLASALASQGLIDEYFLFTAPWFLGGGVPVLKGLGRSIPLTLLETRRFTSGVVMHRYRPA